MCGLEHTIDHIDGDVRDYDKLAATLAAHQPDVAFHLAAQALVLESYEDPRTTFDTNIMGTVNFLEAVRHTPSVRAAVVVTSDKCYENREWVYGYRENDMMGGLDPYSGSKGAAEIVIASMRHSFFRSEGSAHIASVRAGNVIGGGDWAAHRIFPDCIRAILAGEPIAIRNPSSVRPWQHVLDPLYGYLLLGARLCSGGERFVGAWNFGPLSLTMLPVQGLVEAVIEAWGQGEYRIECPDQPGPEEAKFLHLDISKAINQLCWLPKLSFREMVSMAVEGYRVEAMTHAAVLRHRIDQIRAYEEKVDG